MIKLCECGCGKETTMILHTSKKDGKIKGQPNRFLNRHFKGDIGAVVRKMGAWNKGLKGVDIWGDITNHPRYIADRSKLKKSDEKKYDCLYRSWMFSVKRRDEWKCKISREDCKGRLEAHHILPWRDFPELRYDINNGITLCHFHHPRRREDEKRLQLDFQALVSASSAII